MKAIQTTILNNLATKSMFTNYSKLYLSKSRAQDTACYYQKSTVLPIKFLLYPIDTLCILYIGKISNVGECCNIITLDIFVDPFPVKLGFPQEMTSVALTHPKMNLESRSREVDNVAH